MYKKALEMTHQAPSLHAELQKQIQASQVTKVPIDSLSWLSENLPHVT